MKKLLLTLCLVSFLLAQTQVLDTISWCPAGATWVYASNALPMTDTRQYSMYQFEKDTFAYNLNLKKINRYKFTILKTPENNKIRSSNDYIASYLFYKSNDSVFYINSSENLELLYIFSETVGTSWSVQHTENSFLNELAYPINCDSLVHFQDDVSVNSVHFDTINNMVYPFNVLSSSFNEWGYGSIFKNIGATNSFFATPSYTPTSACADLVDYVGYYTEGKLVSYYDDLRQYSFNRDQADAQFIHTPIRALEKEAQILVYPNPATDKIYIDTQDDIERISILDATGKTVEIIKANFDIVSLENYKEGVYFLIIQSAKQSTVKKIVKR